MKDEKVFEIRVLRHKKLDLLMAFSKDLPGLAVHGHTEEELQERLPAAITDLLTAQGYKVIKITLDDDSMPEFDPPAFIANAALTYNHP